ncbi:centaurin-beta-2 [Rhizodiscina lignyota]|uniref:ADP-ribosylation factor GTPase-activating protein n=1 Tax=Rhizodiscina lignyota TaxID=1504668 RepID=A0A9P4I0M4_9PEZI|nr:centaurin-beta-2 [Rhizodiscina lignyota]
MGAVSSRPGDEGAPLYLRDQNRFSVTGLTVTNSRNRTLLNITPNAFPATRYNARRDLGDDLPVDYVQDPDSMSQPSFLVRLNNDDELNFNFTFVLRQEAGPPPADITIAGLTFLFAGSAKDLDNLITREFHADPNLHRNPNVHLVGEYTTAGNSSAQYQWTWRWKPPTAAEGRGGGWRNCCSFVEYNQRAHRLDTLASFSFWVANTNRVFISPKASPRLDVDVPPRLRLPSGHSISSRISDSDATEIASNAPQSPTAEFVPEYGLGLVPTLTGSTAAHAPTVKLDINCQRPGEDVTLTEDGPLFRATMKSMEQRTGSMRLRWKKVLRAAEAAQEAQSSSNDAVLSLMLALKEVSSSSANAVQPAIEHYFDKIAKEILAYERQNTTNIQKMIIEPISKLYNLDIKQAESKKKDFDDESREYYAYVSRYLGQRHDSMKEKKRAETDTKYQTKRRNFELKRFDYSSFMQDLHGGRKDQEVLSHLTKYADTQARGYLSTAKRIEAMIPQLDALSSEVKEADKEFQLQRTEREEKRRAIEQSNKPYVEPTGQAAPAVQPSTPAQVRNAPEVEATPKASASVPIFKINSGERANGSSASVPVPAGRVGVSPNAGQASGVLGSSPADKFKGIRDLEEKDHSLLSAGDGMPLRKEGLLWALSRPGSHVDPKGLNKQAWHKFWIVLDQGKLTEYQNWKQKLELHMDPIDLRVASVREARNAERRFCFEVITPSFTRVYQATSEEDMRTWIASINNALQSAVEGKGAIERISTDSLPGQTRKDIASVLTGKSTSLSSHHKPGNASKIVSRHATVGDRPHIRPEVSSEAGIKLLKQIREADAGNAFCADCGATDKVDWVSINLGIIICIECSGIHRSLGTHISKVRSITLDPTAFTPDVVEILLTIGNRVSNMIWEAKLDQTTKPPPTATREQRLKFITAKYSERAFVQPISSTLSHYSTPEETLLASVKKSDIQNVLYALALRANPNAADRSRNTHSVFLALAAADPASPSGSATPTGSSSPGHARSPSGTSQMPMPQPPTPAMRKPFPVAELLLLNGADLPTQPAPIPLSTSARFYLDQKAEQRSGRRGIGALSGQRMDGAADGSGGSMRDREARLMKRVSAGGRLVRSHGGPAG